MGIPGSNIRVLRQQLGISLRGLAKASGIDMATLSRLENGKGGYSQESIAAIAKALYVSEGVLFADNAVVEAAAVQMRKVPLLSAEQLLAWQGADSLDFEENQPYLHADLRRVGRHSFALRMHDGSNMPAIQIGDDLIFDAGRAAHPGSIVAAQDRDGRIYIGRLAPRPSNVGEEANFEVVPSDPVYFSPSPVTAPGLQIKGTLVERRTYL